MNEVMDKFMLLLGDWLINNKIEDAIVECKDEGENGGTIKITIKKYKKVK